MKILILGASYGSLLSTKLLMAGHDVTLVCTAAEAALINDEGTVVRIQVRGEAAPRLIASGSLPGKLGACTPTMPIPPAMTLWRWPCRNRSIARPKCARFWPGSAQAANRASRS